jgi:hypothetical protein
LIGKHNVILDFVGTRGLARCLTHCRKLSFTWKAARKLRVNFFWWHQSRCQSAYESIHYNVK